jgi:hypothetical protein
MGTPAENVRYGRARAAGRPLPGPPQGRAVRIIEYTVTVHVADGSSRAEPFRLVTSLLDHDAAPAHELAALYHHPPGDARLRLIYQALCALRAPQDADRRGRPRPDLLHRHPRLARDQVCNQAAATPATLHRACQQTIADLAEELLPSRRTVPWRSVTRLSEGMRQRRQG